MRKTREKRIIPKNSKILRLAKPRNHSFNGGKK